MKKLIIIRPKNGLKNKLAKKVIELERNISYKTIADFNIKTSNLHLKLAKHLCYTIRKNLEDNFFEIC